MYEIRVRFRKDGKLEQETYEVGELQFAEIMSILARPTCGADKMESWMLAIDEHLLSPNMAKKIIEEHTGKKVIW